MKYTYFLLSILLLLVTNTSFSQDKGKVADDDFRSTGWHGLVDVSGGIVSVMTTVNVGYQFNRFIYAGIGGGNAYEIHEDNSFYGVFYMDLKANVAKGKYAPFIEARCGMAATVPISNKTIYTRLAIGMNVCKLLQLSLGIDAYGESIKPTLSVGFSF